MRIGLDFDNTLVCYDQLFQTLAREAGLIPTSLPANKTAIRDYLREQDREVEWTRLQGLAYGGRIVEAEPFPGLLACLRHWQSKGWDLFIVSHKTRTPFRGEAYDLHLAARNWIQTHLHAQGLMLGDQSYFELTRSAKLARVRQLELDVFVDDLPDILLDLSSGVLRRLLFDPHEQHPQRPDYERLMSWQQLAETLA